MDCHAKVGNACIEDDCYIPVQVQGRVHSLLSVINQFFPFALEFVQFLLPRLPAPVLSQESRQLFPLFSLGKPLVWEEGRC